MNPGDVVILSGCRTAIGTFGGAFKDVSAVELGTIAVREAESMKTFPTVWHRLDHALARVRAYRRMRRVHGR